MITIKIKINNRINKLKQKLNEHFLFNKSMISLINFSKKFCIFSVGFDNVCHRVKNPKRFKIIIVMILNYKLNYSYFNLYFNVTHYLLSFNVIDFR